MTDQAPESEALPVITDLTQLPSYEIKSQIHAAQVQKMHTRSVSTGVPGARKLMQALQLKTITGEVYDYLTDNNWCMRHRVHPNGWLMWMDGFVSFLPNPEFEMRYRPTPLMANESIVKTYPDPVERNRFIVSVDLFIQIRTMLNYLEQVSHGSDDKAVLARERLVAFADRWGSESTASIFVGNPILVNQPIETLLGMAVSLGYTPSVKLD